MRAHIWAEGESPMSVSEISSSAVSYAPVSAPTPAAPVKDNDGDYDNGAPEVKAATPPGVGGNIDIKA
jgi:hypothetical protein